MSLLCSFLSILCALVWGSDPHLCGRNVLGPLFTSPAAVSVIFPLETCWGAKASWQISHHRMQNLFFTCCVSNGMDQPAQNSKAIGQPFLQIELGWTFLSASVFLFFSYLVLLKKIIIEILPESRTKYPLVVNILLWSTQDWAELTLQWVSCSTAGVLLWSRACDRKTDEAERGLSLLELRVIFNYSQSPFPSQAALRYS